MSNQRSYERVWGPWVIRTWFEHGHRDVPGAINAAGLYGIEFGGRVGAARSRGGEVVALGARAHNRSADGGDRVWAGPRRISHRFAR